MREKEHLMSGFKKEWADMELDIRRGRDGDLVEALESFYLKIGEIRPHF